VTVGVFQMASVEQSIDIDKINIHNMSNSDINISMEADIDASQAVQLMSASSQTLQTSVVNQLRSAMSIASEGNGFSAAAGAGLFGEAGAVKGGPLFASSDVKNIMRNAVNLSTSMSNVVDQQVSSQSTAKQFLNIDEGIDIDTMDNSSINLNLVSTIRSVQNIVIRNKDVQEAIMKLDQSLSATTKTSVPTGSMFWIMCAGAFLLLSGIGAKHFSKKKDGEGLEGKEGGEEGGEKKKSVADYVRYSLYGLLGVFCVFLLYKIATCWKTPGKCFINFFSTIFGGAKKSGEALAKGFGLK